MPEGLYAQFSLTMPIELMRKGCDWRARAVYFEASLHVRAHLTDGVVERALLSTWMPDLPVKQRVKVLDAMAAAGALDIHPDGWSFPPHVWAVWGKNRADVAAQREIKQAAGIKGNHVRHHLPPTGEPSPKCPLCIAEHLAPCSQPAKAQRSHPSRKRSPYPNPESYPETYPETSSPSTENTITPEVPGGPVDIDAWTKRRRMA